VYSGEASFSGVSRDDDDDEGRRRREKAIWRRGVKKNAGSSLCVPPLRAANKENGQNDFERDDSKNSSSADFGEECVGVGMNVECEIPIAECDDDDDKVASFLPFLFSVIQEKEKKEILGSLRIQRG
jgi:hypothetical protein